MKEIMFLKNAMLILSLALVALFTSCEVIDGDDEDGGDNIKSKIVSKWEVQDNKAPFKSIEFMGDGTFLLILNTEAVPIAYGSSETAYEQLLLEGNIVNSGVRSEEDDPPLVYFGSYTVLGNHITLSGLGIIKVISVTGAEFSFSFIITDGNTMDFVSRKSTQAIPSSDRTDMLCRSWVVDGVVLDVDKMPQEDIDNYIEDLGEDWEEKVKEEMLGISVVFSKGGTFITGKDRYAILSEWKWGNSQQTAIIFTVWSEDIWEDNSIVIKSLTSNNLVFEVAGITLTLKSKK